MGRSPCCDKVGLKKGPWTNEEDQKLLAYIQEHGHGSWRALPPKAGLQRCGKSCRLRWTNYLRPDIKRGEFSLQEQQTIIQLHALLGNRWSAIASHLPKRTDNEIKNYWNTHLKKRLTKMGIDPTTHKPKSHGALGSGQPKDMANLSHMAQWETARLEAEARIVRESKLISNPTNYHHHHHQSQLIIKPDAPPPTPRPPCLDILKVWQGTWLTKGKKDISFNGFPSSNPSHQLESPTSILNFSDNNMLTNMINNNNNNNNNDNVVFDSVHENTFLADVNYGHALGGIMGNSAMKVHDDITDIPSSSSTNNIFSDSVRFPISFLEGYADVPAADESADNIVGLIEDNYKISYWSNILNAVGSPVDSSEF